MTPPTLDPSVLAALPRPLLPTRPLWRAAYEGAWAIAIKRGLRQPLPGNPNGEPFIDACFSDHIFQWDSCFIALWLKYAQGAIPGLGHPLAALDNFYAAQDEDGAIPRELHPDGRPAVNKVKAQDVPGTPVFWKHSAFTNPPLFSWAEWEYYQHTGDDSRLARVLPILAGYFDWYGRNRSRKQGYLWWDSFGSGMDNIARPDAYGWIDYTALAALDSEFLANIALHVGDNLIAQACSSNYLSLKDLINTRMWDEYRNCYGDVDEDDLVVGPLHIGCFWPLMANVAPQERAEEMIKTLFSYRSFGRNNLVPSLAAFEKGFTPTGGYWRGGVWAPSTYMVVRALHRAKEDRIAHDIAVNHVDLVARVFQQTDTIWENYAPDHLQPGDDARPDFCGWSALGPIAMLIESVLGLQVDAPMNELNWTPLFDEPHGIENLKVGDALVDLTAALEGRRWRVTVRSSAPVDVRLHGSSGTINLRFDKAGERTATVD